MTEEEAKTKACCGAPSVAAATLLAHPDVSARPIGGLKMGLCIASACMAWRWNEDWVSSVHDPVAGTMTTKLKNGARLLGGCGLAGPVQ